MEVEPFENPWIKKIRLLTHLLIVSVGLNIGLSTYFALIQLKKPVGAVAVSREIPLKASNGEVLKNYFSLDRDSLIGELANVEVVQDGFLKRDLALACLVNFHHFDIERALSGMVLQRRSLSFIHQGGGERFDLEVFSGLDDGHFQLAVLFAKREEWPLTPEGLFCELKKGGSAPPNSLVKAFMSTPQFFGIYTLLQRSGETIGSDRVLKMICEGDFETFNLFKRGLISDQSSGGSALRDLLSAYVNVGSKEAALIWIKIEGEYLLRNLEDSSLLFLIDAIEENTLSTNLFLKKVLCSVRCDKVREASAAKLYAFKGMKVPENYSHDDAIRFFLPSLFAAKEEKVEPVKPPPLVVLRKHLVADGDSLWKIAKKYKVTIEGIRQENKLKSDRLKPGQELTIPAN